MDRPNVTHVVFDLDGTLLNTLEDLARSANHVCETFGWPTFSLDAYRFKVGNGILKLVERIMPAEFAGDGAVYGSALETFRSYYDLHKEDHTAMYPGIDQMLRELKGAGLTLAILTNKDHSAATPLVNRHFGPDVFALAQGHIDGLPPKPAAPLTEHLLEQLGADKSRTLYVGDSNVDVETGHNAGIPVAGVSWGFRGRAELEAAGAEFVVDSPAELTGLILGS